MGWYANLNLLGYSLTPLKNCSIIFRYPEITLRNDYKVQLRSFGFIADNRLLAFDFLYLLKFSILTSS